MRRYDVINNELVEVDDGPFIYYSDHIKDITLLEMRRLQYKNDFVFALSVTLLYIIVFVAVLIK